MNEELLIVFELSILAIGWRLLLSAMDRKRIELFLRDHRGGELIEKRWAPFGRGWLEPVSHDWYGSGLSRMYRIIYRDLQGRVHKSYVKTSMMIDVYVTHDTIIEDLATTPPGGEDAVFKR